LRHECRQADLVKTRMETELASYGSWQVSEPLPAKAKLRKEAKECIT